MRSIFIWSLAITSFLFPFEKKAHVFWSKTLTAFPDTLPLTELGTGLWKNYPGGLYPQGLNQRPADHETNGLSIARSIVPLDSFGKEDLLTGKIVLLSIGMSNTTQEFSVFKTMADSFSLKNPKLQIIDGAQGGQTASRIKDPASNFWQVIRQKLLQQKLSAQQVQVVWLKEANAGPTDPFPKHAEDLKTDLRAIVILMKQLYPNLKQIFLSSRTYGGYASTTLNPEPYAYESGFSVKWLIEEQLTGDSSLFYLGSHPKTAWLSWGPYLWAQGNKPRADGFFWIRDDFVQDGTHPSTSGRLKVANLLLNFFSNDPCSVPWFLKSSASGSTEEIADPASFDLLISNPHLLLKLNLAPQSSYLLELLDIEGRCLRRIVNTNDDHVLQEHELDISTLPAGIYMVVFRSGGTKSLRRFVKSW